MAEVAPGASGSLQVNRDTLKQAAEQSDRISRAIGQLAADVSPACALAASAHSGWQFGKALGAVVPHWQRHLAQRASAVAAAAGKLASSAANYATVENDLVARAQAIYTAR
jgi:hypothetical protein